MPRKHDATKITPESEQKLTKSHTQEKKASWETLLGEPEPIPDDVLTELQQLQESRFRENSESRWIKESAGGAYDALTTAIHEGNGMLSEQAFNEVLDDYQRIADYNHYNKTYSMSRILIYCTIKTDFQAVKCLLDHFQWHDMAPFHLEYAVKYGGLPILHHVVKFCLENNLMRHVLISDLLFHAVSVKFQQKQGMGGKAERYWDTNVVPYVVKLYDVLGRSDLIFSTSEKYYSYQCKSVLHVASASGRTEALRFLICKFVAEKGPESLNVVDVHGHTCLHKAAIMKKIDVVSLLVTYGADVDIRSIYDRTALQSVLLTINRHLGSVDDYKKQIAALQHNGEFASTYINRRSVYKNDSVSEYIVSLERLMTTEMDEANSYKDIANYLLSVGAERIVVSDGPKLQKHIKGIERVDHEDGSTSYMYKETTMSQENNKQTAIQYARRPRTNSENDIVLVDVLDLPTVKSIFKMCKEEQKSDLIFSSDLLDNTVLHQVALDAPEDDRLEVIKYVVRTFEKAGKSELIYKMNVSGLTALHIVAGKGDLESVRFIVSKCREFAQLDETNADNKTSSKFKTSYSNGTVIHVAAAAGHRHVVEYLAKNCGVELDVKGMGHVLNAFQMALSDQQCDDLDSLQAFSAGTESMFQCSTIGQMDVETASGVTALQVAYDNKHYDIVELLVHLGADPTIRNEDGTNTTYTVAAQSDKREDETWFQYAARKGKLSSMTSQRSAMYPSVMETLCQNDPGTGRSLLVIFKNIIHLIFNKFQ